MPRYQAVAREIVLYEVFFEADDDAAAEQFANELETVEFDYVEGDWEVVAVQAIPEPKPDPKQNQLTLF
jgi:hypothetical protein